MERLLVTVRFLENRYHGLSPDGRPEWPPSPARLFQALVAGAAKGSVLFSEDRDAIAWLEQLDAPLIAVPAARKGQSFSHFMPNNDLDTVGGDPVRIGKIRRATKWFHPQIFSPETPLIYVWSFEHGVEHAKRVCEIALRIYQLGRGVDMAWANAEILNVDEVEARLSKHSGALYRPALSNSGRVLPCPRSGSLNSLIERYDKSRNRLKTMSEAVSTSRNVVIQTFSQPPKPRFRQRSYSSPPVRLVYELRDMTQGAGYIAWPLKESVLLVETVRNDAAERLQKALRENAATVARVFGLCRNATQADKTSRIRIIPLPSIGHQHSDHSIRRLLVEIPSDCPLASDDIAWTFSSTGSIDQATGEIRWMLVSTEERGMLRHYGIAEHVHDAFRIWRTVTPMALSVLRTHDRKKGSERVNIEHNVAAAVGQALRYAEITSLPASIRVQREPFDVKGTHAENFAPNTRFHPAQLWHVEVTFAEPVAGPLIAGDGRYLGLGLMKPVKRVEGSHAFVVVDGLTSHADPLELARALRRAVMARIQDQLGPRKLLPTIFTGHELDGAPARRGNKSHLAFAFDEPRQRLLVVAPHLLEGRLPSNDERDHLTRLNIALSELRELRAGSAGLLKLKPMTVDEDDDPLFAQATIWMTQTEYRVTRYSKRATPEQVIIADIALELRRRGFPIPTRIDLSRILRGPRGGLSSQVTLEFATAVKGPLVLGKACHFGLGLFRSA